MTAKAAGMRHAHTCAAQRQKGVALFIVITLVMLCLLYTSPSPRDLSTSRMPSSA